MIAILCKPSSHISWMHNLNFLEIIEKVMSTFSPPQNEIRAIVDSSPLLVEQYADIANIHT